MMAYPTENYKGRFVAIFWSIFNIGAVVGSLIPISANWQNQSPVLTDGTYIAFIVLMALGPIVGCFLTPTSKVVRNDGTVMPTVLHRSAWQEVKGLFKTLKSDPYIVLLFPMFFVSNYYLTYTFNGFNAYWFDLRARSLNNFLYWIFQIIGAIVYGCLLDWTRFTRRQRAIWGWVALFIIVNAGWGYGLIVVLKSSRSIPGPNMDVYDPEYAKYVVLYMYYGFLDTIFQVYIFW